MSKSRLCLFATTVAFVGCIANAAAQPVAKQSIAAKLSCGANSANRNSLREFQVNMTFTLNGDRLEGRRRFRTGYEIFQGTISSTGAMLISGTGTGKDGGSWKYELSGTRDNTGDTVVSGQRINTNGIVGTRDCKIVFSKPRFL